VAALRASDGARMWTSEVGAVRHPPAVDGDLLYVAMADRRVLALDVTTGAVRWQRRLGGVPGEPFAVGGQLYVGAEDRFFYALEADSGEIAWRIRVGAAARGHAAADEDRVYFVGMDNVVYAFDRGDGALEWRRGITYRPSSGPALVGDAVIVPGPVVSLPAVGARRGTDAGTIPFGTKLATVPRVVALPGGLTHLAAITGDLDATWRLSLIGPELIPRLPVVPLTELPGVPIPVAPPGR
jgi:outer membrane protein assembly factor BamB